MRLSSSLHISGSDSSSFLTYLDLQSCMWWTMAYLTCGVVSMLRFFDTNNRSHVGFGDLSCVLPKPGPYRKTGLGTWKQQMCDHLRLRQIRSERQSGAARVRRL